MFQIIGIVLLFGLVFGSYLMGGGKMDVIIEAAPHELMAILGAGIAAFLISNSMVVIKATAAGFGKIINISTSRSTMLVSGSGPYGACKAGLEAATAAVAKALERRFGPGPIDGALSAFVVSARKAEA